MVHGVSTERRSSKDEVYVSISSIYPHFTLINNNNNNKEEGEGVVEGRGEGRGR